MADSTVKPSGGDFTQVAVALLDAGTGNGDTITVSGDWTSSTDGGACTVSDNDITVVVTLGDDARHKGVKVATNHEITHTGTNHVMTIASGVTGFVLDGLILKQGGTTSSAEGIRFITTNAATIKNLIIWAGTETTQQDGIYCNVAATINVENTYVFGFGRAGMHNQNGDNATWNINSCGLFHNNTVSAGGNVGGIVWAGGDGGTVVFNIHNTWSIGNDEFTGADFVGSNATWNVSNCIDGDGTTSIADTGANNFTNRAINEATAGGDEIIVVEKDTLPHDLTLVDDATNNDAQDVHTDDEAHGLTIPSTDIANTTRPQNTSHDIGPFEVVVVVAAPFPPWPHQPNTLVRM